MALTPLTQRNDNTTPPTTPDSVTGNVIFVVLVAILAATVLIPIWRGELPPETLSNIAIGSMGVVGTLAAGAAGWHFRGKQLTPAPNPPPTDAAPTTPVTVVNQPGDPVLVKETPGAAPAPTPGVK